MIHKIKFNEFYNKLLKILAKIVFPDLTVSDAVEEMFEQYLYPNLVANFPYLLNEQKSRIDASNLFTNRAQRNFTLIQSRKFTQVMNKNKRKTQINYFQPAKVLENSFVLEENKDLHDFVEENQKVCRFDKENEIKANKSLSKSSDFEELNTKNKSISNSSDFEELHAKNKSISKQYSINKDFNEKNSYLSQNNDLKQDFEQEMPSIHEKPNSKMIQEKSISTIILENSKRSVINEDSFHQKEVFEYILTNNEDPESKIFEKYSQIEESIHKTSSKFDSKPSKLVLCPSYLLKLLTSCTSFCYSPLPTISSNLWTLDLQEDSDYLPIDRKASPSWKDLSGILIETMQNSLDSAKEKTESLKITVLQPNFANILAIIGLVTEMYTFVSVAFSSQVGWLGDSSESSDVLSNYWLFEFWIAFAFSILFFIAARLGLKLLGKGMLGLNSDKTVAKVFSLSFLLSKVSLVTEAP